MEPDGPRDTDEIERRLGRPLTDDERAALAATYRAEAERAAAREAPQRAYRPIHPEPAWRALARRAWAPLIGIAAFLVKFGGLIFKAKFLFSAFISVGWYALFWGWKLGVGFVVLIFLHEVGHVIEAKRQGLAVHKLAFVPLLGAYVLHERAATPYRGALIALAGPAFGGLTCAVCWAIGESMDSDFWRALAFLGFLVNALNLIPLSLGWIMLDGAAVIRVANPVVLAAGAVGLGVIAWRSENFFLVLVLAIVLVMLWKEWRERPARIASDRTSYVDPGHANLMAVAYATVAVLLVLGAIATHLPDPR